MDIYEALYTTRSMRRLKSDPIPYDVQARILDAAIRAPIEILDDQSKADTQMGRMLRSGLHLVHHFAEVPLLLIGFGRTTEGSGIYPALQNAMLAGRAEGIGSTLTGFLQTYFANEVMDILGVPKEAGWYM